MYYVYDSWLAESTSEKCADTEGRLRLERSRSSVSAVSPRTNPPQTVWQLHHLSLLSLNLCMWFPLYIKFNVLNFTLFKLTLCYVNLITRPVKNTFEEQKKNCPFQHFWQDSQETSWVGYCSLPCWSRKILGPLARASKRCTSHHDRHPSLYLQSGGSRMVVGVLFFPFLNLD